MKSFIVSLAFFLATVIAVSVNCFYVEQELSEMLEFLETIPEVSEESQFTEFDIPAKKANDMWKNSLTLLSLSVENNFLRDCSIAFGNLEAYTYSESVPDYNAALSDCITRLSYLLSRERFSIKNAL